MANICDLCGKEFNDLLGYQVTAEIRSPRVCSNINWAFCTQEHKDEWYKKKSAVGILPVRDTAELRSQHLKRSEKIQEALNSRLEVEAKNAGRELTKDEVTFLYRAIEVDEPRIDMSSYLLDEDEDLQILVHDGKNNNVDAETFKTANELNEWWAKG